MGSKNYSEVGRVDHAKCLNIPYIIKLVYVPRIHRLVIDLVVATFTEKKSITSLIFEY